MTGLLDMVRLMGQSRIEPIVLFYRDNPHIDRFRALGAEVVVLRDAGAASPLPAGAAETIRPLKRVRAIKELNRLLRRDRHLAGSIREHLRELEPDLVHHNDNPRGDRASILAAWLEGMPQVCHVRFADTLYAPVDRFVARTADRLIFVSEWIKETVDTELGRIVDDGEVVYDPVEYEAFIPDPEARESVAREFGLDPEAPLVVNVGRLVEWKGQHVFIEAASHVLERYPDTHFLVVGSGAEVGSGYVERLHSLARDLGIEESVVYTGRRDDVPRIMAAADAVVHSSIRPEPFGRVIVEALACQTPVVASDAGGPREIVDDGETGFLTVPGDPASMAEAVEDLLANPSKARRMGEAGRRTATRRFSVAKFRSRIEAIYAGVVNRSVNELQLQSGTSDD